jgi:hypothetical protein
MRIEKQPRKSGGPRTIFIFMCDYPGCTKEMKVIFLDFDGVLNSAASFRYEDRRREKLALENPDAPKLCKVNETLCNVCTSNFQLILDHFPKAKIVISSTWRELFELDWLKEKLASYGIDSSRVIDKTPISYGGPRGSEIQAWLNMHPEVKKYVVLDDNEIDGGIPDEKVVKTTWDTGLTLPHVFQAIKVLDGKPIRYDLGV